MPFSGGVAGAHGDSMHQDDAKRDTALGLAGLDAAGDVLAPGANVVLTRNGSDEVELHERTSGEVFARWVRAGVNDYAQWLHVGAVPVEVLHTAMKDVASGIAGLDASVEIPLALLKVDVANGIAGLDADAVIPHEMIRVGSFRAEHRRKVVSNDLRQSHDSEDPILSGSWAKYKTITMTNGISGTLRIKHSSYCENGLAGATHSRVYKNGSPLGADNANTTDMSYVEYSEDLNVGDLQPGDTLELWAYDAAYPDFRSVKNFRMYYVNEASTVVASANS